MSATSAVDDLQRYFESLYREGGEFKVKSTRPARIWTIPGSIFEQASLYGKMPLICQGGQVPRHSHFMVKSMWKGCIHHVHPSAFLCWSTRRMLTTFQWGQRLRCRQRESHRAWISVTSCWMRGGWSCQCSSSPVRCSPSTRSSCSESWSQDCERAFGACSVEARLLPASVPSILTHCYHSTIWQVACKPWACWKMRNRSAPSVPSILGHGSQSAIWHVASKSWASWKMHWGCAHGPPKLSCRAVLHLLAGRTALQESFGGPWAHPRCRASWHIGLSQRSGNLPASYRPAKSCRTAL